MTADALFRSFIERNAYAERIAISLARRGFTPNILSLLALLTAALSGVFFAASRSSAKFNLTLLIAGIFVALNAFFDMFDGILARATHNTTRKGDFLEHVFDRYSDVFIIIGIIMGGHVRWDIGAVAMIGVLLSSYVGVQAQAVGLHRVYGGVLGRADRLLIIIGATIFNAFHSEPIISPFGELTPLGLIVVVIAFLSHLTAIQRFIYAWRML